MGKFKSSEFARIRCTNCGDILDTINPGSEFDQIEECDCQSSRAKGIANYDNMELAELRIILQDKDIPFSMQAGKPTLIKKLKG